MLRISSIGPATGRSEPERLRLDGQVTGPWVEELRRACAERLVNDGHTGTGLILDLAGVSFLDAAGVALLRELAAAHRVALTNSSPFIAEQLKEVASVDG